MTVAGLFNVARKEFADHLTSRRFLVILGLFLIISTMGLYQGIQNYNQQLESYAEQMARLPAGEDIGWMPERPSVLNVFMFMASEIGTLGAILGIAMGFDLISREKETRSLKSLLSHPVYRDEIVNGKALGGVLALAFAMGAGFLVSLAVLLIFSIVPGIGELSAIALLGAVSVVYLLSFFAVALLMSTVSSESGNALIYSLVIFFTLAVLMSLVGGTLTTVIVGDPPEPPDTPYPMPIPMERVVYAGQGAASSTVVEKVETIIEDKGEWQRYEEEMRAYWEKRRAISDAVNLVSPQVNYMTIAMAIMNPRYITYMDGATILPAPMPGGESEPDLMEVLGKLWKNIAALFVFPVVFFGVAYVKFMRMDVR
ncbi:MAG: ABC transporter permease subunit [Methanomicrobiales archaeon]|nr:ABC transporter permease subunit [Methanomicrobiales archaeon]MDI6876256.1 ABC transporter permease subunit [Methanomicrobiales archaeon]